MDPITIVNERVAVVARYQTKCDVSKICLPYKMRWRNQDIVFAELGMKHPSTKGRRMIHVFDMSDGANDYRLEFDAESLTWTLVALLEGSHYVRD